MEGFLKRYTELPFLIYALKNKKLTLLNPTSWDDKNDAHHLLAYKKRENLGSVLTLCFTEASETYHHWKVFSGGGSSGVCIDFKKREFETWAYGVDKLRFGKVKYYKLNDTRKSSPQPEELPFIKRHAFRDEREVRLIYETDERDLVAKDIDLDLSIISRVVLSPWLPVSIANSVKEIVRNINDCGNLNVSRTTLINNEEWKRFGVV